MIDVQTTGCSPWEIPGKKDHFHRGNKQKTHQRSQLRLFFSFFLFFFFINRKDKKAQQGRVIVPKALFEEIVSFVPTHHPLRFRKNCTGETRVLRMYEKLLNFMIDEKLNPMWLQFFYFHDESSLRFLLKKFVFFLQKIIYRKFRRFLAYPDDTYYFFPCGNSLFLHCWRITYFIEINE